MKDISRRDFIYKSGTIAASFAVVSAVPSFLLSRFVNAGGKSETVSKSQLKVLASGFHGTILSSSDLEFQQYGLAMNKRVLVSPQVVAFCKTESDVCHTVRWAHENQFEPFLHHLV